MFFTSLKGGLLRKRPLTTSYIIFYILFSPDTWRILIGVAVAVLLAPRIIQSDHGMLGTGAIYVMLASIGYAFSILPGRWISNTLKKLVLTDKRP